MLLSLPPSSLSPTTASLKEVNITVVGPTYPDDSIEEAPSPLQIAAMFGSVSSEQPLSLPLDAAAESKW